MKIFTVPFYSALLAITLMISSGPSALGADDDKKDPRPSKNQVQALIVGYNAMSFAWRAAWYAAWEATEDDASEDVVYDAADDAVWSSAYWATSNASQIPVDSGTAANDAAERAAMNDASEDVAYYVAKSAVRNATEDANHSPEAMGRAAAEAAYKSIFRNNKIIPAIQEALTNLSPDRSIVKDNAPTVEKITEDLFDAYNSQHDLFDADGNREKRAQAHPLAVALFQLTIYHFVTGKAFDPNKNLMQHYIEMYDDYKDRGFIELLMFAATKTNRDLDENRAFAASPILNIRTLGIVKQYLGPPSAPIFADLGGQSEHSLILLSPEELEFTLTPEETPPAASSSRCVIQ